MSSVPGSSKQVALGLVFLAVASIGVILLVWPPPPGEAAESAPGPVDPMAAVAGGEIAAEGGGVDAELVQVAEPKPELEPSVGGSSNPERATVDTQHPELAAIEGLVVDWLGEPIEGVAVTAKLVRFPAIKRTMQTETNAEGVFRFENVVVGRATLSFVAQGLCSESLRPIQLVAGEVSRVEPVQLHRGAEVHGFVRVDGQPAPALQIWILRARGERTRSGGHRAATDKQGKFKLSERVAPGDYRVLVLPAKLGPFGRGLQRKLVAAEFTIAPGQQLHTAQIDLQGRPDK